MGTVPLPPPDIEAEIHFFAREEGGRRTPCKSGYRPSHDFGIEGMLNDAVHQYIDKEWVSPGETVLTHLSFLAPETQFGRLYEGFEFTVQEGTRIVGRGRIIRVFNQILISAEQ